MLDGFVVLFSDVDDLFFLFSSWLVVCLVGMINIMMTPLLSFVLCEVSS